MRGLWSIPIIGPLIFAAWKIDARRKLGWMQEFLSSSDKIIDIGSGPGSLLLVMRERGFDIDGLDITDSAYKDTLKAHIYDGKTMPFGAQSYDTALLSTMLHHTPDPDHILRESARIANRLMETAMRGALEQRRLLLVRALVVVVAKFVINHTQLVVSLIDAHLDAQVVAAVEPPGAGMTNDVTIRRLREHRPLPERIWQSRHTERHIETLGRAHHFLWRKVLGLEG